MSTNAKAKGKPSSSVATKKRPAPMVVPQPVLRRADLIEPSHLSGRPAILARGAGVMAAASAIAIVASGYSPYLVLAGIDIKAPVTVAGVLGQLLLAAPILLAAGLLIAGRGGRFGLAMLLPSAAAAVGASILVAYETAQINSHPSLEFYYGRGYATTTIEAAIGHDLALLGQLGLVVVLVLATTAWSGTSDSERSPLGRERVAAAGFVLTTGVIGALGLLFPPAVGVLRTTLGADGIEVVVPTPVPAGPLDTGGLALIGGLGLSIGVLLAACVVSIADSRVALLGGLLGLGSYLTAALAANLRDLSRNDDLVPGIRTYTLATAAGIAVLGVIYLARVRREESDALGSAAADRLGVLEEELT